VSKNLTRYRDLKIILLDRQSNYVGRSSIMSNAVKFWCSSNQLERPT